MSDREAKYFDLLTTGLGYINRVREVAPEEGREVSLAEAKARFGLK